MESVSPGLPDVLVLVGPVRQLLTASMLLVPGDSIPVADRSALEHLHDRLHRAPFVPHTGHYFRTLHFNSHMLLLIGYWQSIVPILRQHKVIMARGQISLYLEFINKYCKMVSHVVLNYKLQFF